MTNRGPKPKQTPGGADDDPRSRQLQLLEHVVQEKWDFYRAIVRQGLSPRIRRLESTVDVVQSAVGSAVRIIQLGKVTAANLPQLEALLLTMLRNRCATKARYYGAGVRDHRKAGPMSGEESLGAALATQPKQWLRLQAAETVSRIKALPSNLREAIELDFQGYSNAELATRLDVSVATAKRRLRSAIRLLALSLGYCPALCGGLVKLKEGRCGACREDWEVGESEAATQIAAAGASR